jgi:hypothetical protein
VLFETARHGVSGLFFSAYVGVAVGWFVLPGIGAVALVPNLVIAGGAWVAHVRTHKVGAAFSLMVWAALAMILAATLPTASEPDQVVTLTIAGGLFGLVMPLRRGFGT